MANNSKKKKGKQKQQSVSKRVLTRLQLSGRINTLEKLAKEQQNALRALMDHLEASRGLNAHYLVSINTLAKVLVDAGLCTESILNEARVWVISETDFNKKKHEWMETCTIYDSTTDKYYYWDLSKNREHHGPFWTESDAYKAAMEYISDFVNKRQKAMDRPKPHMLTDRVAELEKMARTGIFGQALNASSRASKESENDSNGSTPVPQKINIG